LTVVVVVMVVGRVFFAVMAGFWVVVLLLVVGLVSLILPKAGSEGLGLAMGRAERRSAIGEVCRSQYLGRSLDGLGHLLGDRFVVCGSW
jgi:hypothetical protein